MFKPDISIIVPAFNEADRLDNSLHTIIEFLEFQISNFQIIVVDDGSTDSTALAAKRRFAAHPPNISPEVVSYKPNRGKGYAVRAGLSAASGKISIFSDADLSTPITEMEKIIKPISEGAADITIGSRALDRSLIGTHQSWTREQGGKIFNLIVRLFTGLPFADTQCGFKAFRTAVIQPILRAAQVDRFGFDVELLLVAFAAELQIAEIPVIWNHSEGSTVNFQSDSWKMFDEVLTINRNLRRGSYKNAIDEVKSLAGKSKVEVKSQLTIPEELKSATQ